MFGRKHNASALASADAGPRSAEIISGARPDLDKHQGTVVVAHNQVNFAATSTRGAVVTGKQRQAMVEQITQGALLGGVAALLGIGVRERGVHWFNVLIPHW